MKAVTRTKYGPPDVLRITEMEVPVPKANEVLIRVQATTVNRTDCAVLTGKPFVMRFFTGLFKPKLIAGTDFAGTVHAVGKEVTAFKVGDRVWGFLDTGLGSHAQYFTFRADLGIMGIPDSITYAQAAASPEGAHYAYNVINKVKLQAGQKVLVYGATGAIGSALVQMLKSLGVYVTAVCGTDHVDLVRTMGADKVVDYLKQDFTKDELQYAYVFDAVGKSTFSRCKPLLIKRGIYISSELGPMMQNPFLALITPLLGGKKVIFPVPSDVKRSLRFIHELLQKGEFRPLIDRTYPMEEIAEAYKYVGSGKKIGNVIITFE